MADRFWVGGGSANTWAATGNTNWAATSGGANNASVPTTTDRAIFDANSGVSNSVIGANITVQSLICTNYAGTLTHNSAVTLTLNTAAVDTLILGASMTYSPASTSAIIALTNTTGTADITSNGKRMAALTLNGVGGTFRLLDALRVDSILNAILTLTNGIFNANNFNVTAYIFSSSNSNTRTITMGSGLWLIGGNVSGNSTIWTTATVTGLTFNKNTANIEIAASATTPAAARIFSGGGLTYNTLTIDANSANSELALVGANTFAALAVGFGNALSLPSNVITTITTAPTWTGTQASPILVYSGGTLQGTLSIASGTLTLTWGGLRDCIGSGGANFVATNTLDFGNNSGWSIGKPADASVAPLDAAGVRAALGLASANLDTQLAALQSDTDNIQTRLPTALVGGRIDASVGAYQTGMTPLQPATAGRTLVVDAAGLADANMVKLGPTSAGTAQTARDIGASVLLSAGTGTGQIDFTSGVVKANLAQILGTALTETAGLLAGGFKKFFNVATPAATMDHGVLVDTVTTATTASNLTTNNDKTGYSLTQAFPSNFSAIGISASGHISNVDTVTTYTGNTPQTGDAYARIGAAGAGLTALGDTRIVHLDVDVSTRLASGSYTSPPSAATIAQAVWDVLTSALTTVGSVGKLIVTNIDAAISSRSSYAGGDTAGMTTLLSRLGSPAGATIAADIAAVKSDTGAIKTKTDNLPIDPADQSLIIAATDAIKSDTGSIKGLTDVIVHTTGKLWVLNESGNPLAGAASLATTDGKVGAVKTKTDSLTFTVAGHVDANIKYVADDQIIGSGIETTDEWRPA